MAEQESARRDALSGVLKYEAFVDALTRRAAEADEDEGSLSLAMADLDWFARVNAEHGRAVGDETLDDLLRKYSL